MIITDSLITSTQNIEHYKSIADNHKMHSFTIIRIEDTDHIDMKKMTFTIEINRLAYFIIDLFYTGKKVGILESSNKSNETAY